MCVNTLKATWAFVGDGLPLLNYVCVRVCVTVIVQHCRSEKSFYGR